MKIIKFNSKEEYEQWLNSRSFYVQDKARKFKEKFGDIIPVVIDVNGDTYCEGGGVYLFLHPAYADLIVSYSVLDYE